MVPRVTHFCAEINRPIPGGGTDGLQHSAREDAPRVSHGLGDVLIWTRLFLSLGVSTVGTTPR